MDFSQSCDYKFVKFCFLSIYYIDFLFNKFMEKLFFKWCNASW